MGLWPAEEGEDPVAKVPCHVPAEAAHRAGSGLLITGGNLVPLLGVQTGRELGGTHEVAEEYGELPALTCRHARGAVRGGRRIGQPRPTPTTEPVVRLAGRPTRRAACSEAAAAVCAEPAVLALDATT